MSLRYIKSIDQQTSIDIIIPAAGLGKRMKSYGPKPLINIKKNLTIIDNQLRLFKKYLPEARIILVSGFQSDLLMNQTPDDIIKIENEKYDRTNVVRSIGMGLRASTQDVLIVYGDLIFNHHCINSMDYNNSSVLIGNGIMKTNEIGCIANNKGMLENMMYDLPSKWGQIAFFKGRELDMLKRVCWNENNYKMFGFEAINKIIDDGGKFKCVQNPACKCIDIDNSKDLNSIGDII